jgi:hypothetical protein
MHRLQSIETGSSLLAKLGCRMHRLHLRHWAEVVYGDRCCSNPRRNCLNTLLIRGMLSSPALHTSWMEDN